MNFLARFKNKTSEFKHKSTFLSKFLSIFTGKCHGKCHVIDRRPFGSKCWYINGQTHREDGPAIIYPDGTKYWCLNGDFHREDGPAVEKADGSKRWYLNDKYYSREDYYKELYKRNLIDKKQLVLELL